MIDIQNVSFQYLGRTEQTLKNINLEISTGEMVLLTGRTGCGKSTLLKVINAMIPTVSQGLFNGRAYLDNMATDTLSPDELGKYVGTVYQNPDDQLFAMNVFDEVSFALENQGVERSEIELRVNKLLTQVGLGGLAQNGIHELSGGQRQRLALASVLITEPKILVLDEPVSQLNPQGVKELMEFLRELNRERRMTIIVVEHRVHELAEYFQRIVLMTEGRIAYDGEINSIWSYIGDVNLYGMREPEYIKLAKQLHLPDFSLKAETLAANIKKHCPPVLHTAADRTIPTKPCRNLLTAQGLSYRYKRHQKKALEQVDFTVGCGEIVALMGTNGSGKSTLMNLLAGLNDIQEGKIEFASPLSEIAFLRQEPDLMLLCPTIQQEINWGHTAKDTAFTEKIADKLGLSAFMQDYPLAMTKGQRLRIVLAALLAGKPKLLLLDEPTTGQDEQSLQEVADIIRIYRRLGGSVVFCTHDVELAARLADRIVLLNAGRVIISAEPSAVLVNRNLIQMCGLQEPPMLRISELLGIGPHIGIKGVLQDVKPTIVGG